MNLLTLQDRADSQEMDELIQLLGELRTHYKNMIATHSDRTTRNYAERRLPVIDRLVRTIESARTPGTPLPRANGRR